jgi:hypothetical protein
VAGADDNGAAGGTAGASGGVVAGAGDDPNGCRGGGEIGCRVKFESIAMAKVLRRCDAVAGVMVTRILRANAGDCVKRRCHSLNIYNPGMYWQVSFGGYAMSMRVAGPSRAISRRSAFASSATQPAVGANLGRAIWMNTALPRPTIRGRVLWLISMMKS